jgi:hypothetical protein
MRFREYARKRLRNSQFKFNYLFRIHCNILRIFVAADSKKKCAKFRR